MLFTRGFFLFLPALPAYLWVWTNLSGSAIDIFQCISYVYILGGSLIIGLRRWSWSQLGLNKSGLGLSLACGLSILAGRLMIILSVDWTVHPAPFTLLGLLGNLMFYFGLVGLGEELLYRGLIYRALEEWLGVRGHPSGDSDAPSCPMIQFPVTIFTHIALRDKRIQLSTKKEQGQ
jgi:membrane protease YdiL (CAAX protease family)